MNKKLIYELVVWFWTWMKKYHTGFAPEEWESFIDESLNKIESIEHDATRKWFAKLTYATTQYLSDLEKESK